MTLDSDKTYFLKIKNMPVKEARTGKLISYTLAPEINEFKPDLKSLQDQVGGYIEHFIINNDLAKLGIDMWIDEEGKLKNDMHPTFALLNQKADKIVDCIFGSCVFTRYDEEGNTLGLTEEDINRIFNWLGSLIFQPVRETEGMYEFAFCVPGFHDPFEA